MTDRQALLDELYAAEGDVRSAEHRKDVQTLADVTRRAKELSEVTEARIDRRDAAIAAWEAFMVAEHGDVNVHEAVEAIADPVPNTPDNSYAEEDFGWQVGDAPAVNFSTSIPDEPTMEEAVAPVRLVIGRPGEVTDEMLAEARIQDQRDAERRAANGLNHPNHYD